MLRRENRLRRQRDVERTLKRGRYGGTEALQAKVLYSGLAHARAVVIVSKKISKRAVVRNTIRRRLSAQLRELWATIKPGYDIVINVRQDLAKTPVGELNQHLKRALAQAGAVADKG